MTCLHVLCCLVREPKTTALIFRSGKVVVTGAKSETLVKQACRKHARIIQQLGYPDAKFRDFAIRNVVGNCSVKFPIHLEALAYAHANYATYEPEIFPGLVYQMVQPKATLLVFVSGNVVIAGARSQDDLYDAFENLYPVLQQYKKTQ